MDELCERREEKDEDREGDDGEDEDFFRRTWAPVSLRCRLGEFVFEHLEHIAPSKKERGVSIMPNAYLYRLVAGG